MKTYARNLVQKYTDTASNLSLTDTLQWGATVLLVPVLLLLPMMLDGYTVSQIALYSCYGLLAISLALLWGQLGLLCLGQAIFFGVGAYAMAFSTLGLVPFVSEANSFVQLIGILLAIGVPMALAYVMAKLLFNGRTLDGAYLGLVTLALAVISERFFENWGYAGGSNGLMGVPALAWNGTALSETAMYYLMISIVIITCVCLYKIKYSHFGTLLQAIQENEQRTQHMGVNTKKIKTQLFVVGAGIAGLAGALFASQLFFVSPKLVGFALSTEILIWVAVGGRFSYASAFLGALLVRLLEDQLGAMLSYWQLMLGCVFIAVVLFSPKGVFGRVFK